MYYTIANAFQRIDAYEDAIRYFELVIHQWPEFGRNWFAQHMIAKCYEQLLRNGIISQEDAKFMVIDACHKYQERYPDSPAIATVQELLNKYENLNPTLQ